MDKNKASKYPKMTFEAGTTQKSCPRCNGFQALASRFPRLCNEDVPEEAILFGKAILELAVLAEQWNSKNVCILHCFGFVLPLGAAGFSPRFPILMVLSILASPLLSWYFFSCGRRVPWTAPSPSCETQNCPQPLSVGLHLAQGTRGRELRIQQGFALVGTLSRDQFKTSLFRASAEPSLGGMMQSGTAEISPSSAHLKQVRSCGKRSGKDTAHRWR